MRLELISIKSILRRKKRVFFLLFTIIMAVAIVNTLYKLNDSMYLEIGDTFDKLGPNIIITSSANDLDLAYGGVTLPSARNEGTPLIADDFMKIFSIMDADSIAAVSPKLLDIGQVNSERSAVLLGVYFQFEELIKPWWSWQGQLPFANDEVLLGSTIAKQLGKDIGEQLIIEDETFLITGILDVTGTDEDHVIFMPLLTLQDLKGHGENISFIEVAALCTTCPLPEIMEQIREVLPHANVVALQEAVEVRINTVERIQEFMLYGSVIIIVISSLVIGMAMMNYVFDRKVEIGVLRAVGLRRSHVFEVLMTEALIIGLIGGLAGYSLGTMFAKYITPYVVSIPLTIEFNLAIGGTSILTTIVITLLASLLPIYRVTKLDPVEALRM
ncbi:ABC transporter permease [Desulfuribacillus alkaliarsenatis]|uniref:ABC transporter permease n=1 Tax=Desulfuribacillus alkaliarsenatis TaxID=766136 RepID=A0A1E5G4S2_9FIRM|nr:FtsX-like permease family protein [Desulfuribacillus alkaliarsenatis]OEF98180.1 hypothetical protein BHF68_00370 [Desulfuribacillus alkaliarsenatis]